ncbi:hypothetical protein GCWU000341_00292 [Oribacterium sp. oral taxon 078 str. F0262]|nr:hypothetical protein GCWU000341_00292 [Oribacterium sp. oral taxon 078 str. F0262]
MTLKIERLRANCTRGCAVPPRGRAASLSAFIGPLPREQRAGDLRIISEPEEGRGVLPAAAVTLNSMTRGVMM